MEARWKHASPHRSPRTPDGRSQDLSRNRSFETQPKGTEKTNQSKRGERECYDRACELGFLDVAGVGKGSCGTGLATYFLGCAEGLLFLRPIHTIEIGGAVLLVRHAKVLNKLHTLAPVGSAHRGTRWKWRLSGKKMRRSGSLNVCKHGQCSLEVFAKEHEHGFRVAVCEQDFIVGSNQRHFLSGLHLVIANHLQCCSSTSTCGGVGR